MRKTDDDVKEVIKQVAKILKDPHTRYFVSVIYGVELKLTVESATELSTNLTTDIKGTNQLVGIGTTASLTGKHFDRIFTDDIINVKDRSSKAERERIKLVYQELQNIKNRDGRIFNTLTPWHKDDASILMPNIERFDCYHPEIAKVISREDLEKIRERMSPALFAANYELRHVAAEDVIFTNPQVGAEQILATYGIAHLDSAFDGKDYTALTIIHQSNGYLYIFGKIWRKHVLDCYNDIVQLYKDFHCTKLYNEKNADKGLVARDLKKLGLKTVTYSESQNKYIKIVTYLKKAWKDIIFVKGTDDEYIDQICDYTDVAEHDDAPDSASCAVRVLYPKLGREEYNEIAQIVTP